MRPEYLGQKVRDKITGFEGTVTGYAEYLVAKPIVLIESIDNNGRPIEWWALTERIEFI